MEKKKYSSYTEIERDLEILKLEKEIYYEKILLSIDKTKESILPSKSVTLIGNVYQKVFSGTYVSILKMFIPYVYNWYLKRKRGN
ncbi:hypothetical protein O8E88_000938 [Flavobacterium psychrophilum]|uniref:DUF6327 family protein n=1 Tax=Flavobacterium psychrophilum TaxID=96345 RepID=UPI0004F7F6D2|nr:DUF6327 family protein [Flavobacterium psychrophilum]AIN72951.1 hypothetical protein FPG3_00045 [Flavobacterium psychrophilum FPG3]EKT2069144.1 hypothetical protein [Flavobacterium psychrophilum]EKT2071242.1 hypothetical protein [Flavobacterium psychrophilum]EKT4490762.1 hypothetical protein [Flavobacterium psychrophilum]ELY1978971.1 hypothetical protein [Flavobacterium psychrophilum]